MIYVTEVKYPDDEDFHPLMRNEHQPEATCDKEDCMMQVQTMNDPKNKHYPGIYQMATYKRESINLDSFSGKEGGDGAKQPPEDDEVETSDEGQGDSTPENDPDEEETEGEGDAKDAA